MKAYAGKAIAEGRQAMRGKELWSGREMASGTQFLTLFWRKVAC